MPAWMLLDYGQVLSTAPPEREWAELRRAAGPVGEHADGFHALYWKYRPEYDRGDVAVAEYWARVLDHPPSVAKLDELIRWDVAIWLHPHEPSVEAARRAADRGWHLALFSNAPVEVADAIDTLDWLAPFERRFYSCRLRRMKPEPEAYRQVLQGLGADPADIVFFDDRPENVEAAEQLGIPAHVFTDAAQIDAAVDGGEP